MAVQQGKAQGVLARANDPQASFALCEIHLDIFRYVTRTSAAPARHADCGPAMLFGLRTVNRRTVEKPVAR
jgi:hypothetical protein